MKYCPICERKFDDEAILCDVDGATLHDAVAGASNLVGKTIRGRYTVSKKLGEGGMAVVYLAEQVNIGRTVALKVLHGQYSRDPEFVRRFRQEAKLAASLNHPNVVQIYDFDQAEDGTLFIAMEYLDGRSLRAMVQRGPLGIEKALCLGIQMAEGFAVAHRAGVIHRDIKPENIMVTGTAEEYAKLMDFGIARLRQDGPGTRLTKAGIIMGTPMYMAPEQIEGGEVTERTDIYALGIVFYEMLSGVAPFKAPTPAAVLMKQLKETPVSLRKLRADIPTGIQRIVAQTLEKRPDRRPANMTELATSLKGEHSKLTPAPVTQTIAATQVWDVGATQVLDNSTLTYAGDGFGFKHRLTQWLGRKPRNTSSRLPTIPSSKDSSTSATALFESPDKTSTETIAATMVSASVTFADKVREGKRSGLWMIGLACIASIAAMFLFKDYFFQSTTEQKTATIGSSKEVTPAAINVSAVTIRPEKEELKVKERARVGFTVRYADGREIDSNDQIQWWSSNPTVLEVLSSGEMEAKSAGKVELMARLGNVNALPVVVSVKEPEAPPAPPMTQLVSIRIYASRNEINATERLPLRAKGKFSNGREGELKNVRWQSNDVSVASIYPTGEILGHKTGKVTVFASHDGVMSDPFVINVRSVPPKPPLPEKKVVPPEPLTGPEYPKEQIVTKRQGLQDGAVRELIKLAREYRDRGEYTQALTELEKALLVNRDSRELQEAIVATRRACNAERNLGRSDLKC